MNSGFTVRKVRCTYIGSGLYDRKVRRSTDRKVSTVGARTIVLRTER
jgi:hypothetical protein